MKFCLALLVCMAISFLSFSQLIPKNPNVTDAKGLRQGKWTVVFDASWNPVGEEKAVYYRLIEYLNDRPVGMVRDYYVSTGKIQWEGILLEDRPEDKRQGLSTWYAEDGTKIQESLYEGGKEIKVVYFNWDGSEVVESWVSLMSRGEKSYNEGKYVAALQLFKKAVIQAQKEFGPHLPDYYVTSLQNVAQVNKTLGFYDDVEKTLLEALKIREGTVGKEHFAYASILHNLAGFYFEMGIFDKAETLYLQVKNIREKTIGKNNLSYTLTLNNLASLYQQMGFYDKAEPLFIEAKMISETTLGKNDPGYAVSVDNLGSIYEDMWRFKEAETLFLEAKAIREKTIGKEHPHYALSLSSLGNLYINQNLFSKAEPILSEALTIKKKTYGTEHMSFANSLNELGMLYESTGRLDQAEEFYTQAKDIYAKVIGKDHPYYATSLVRLSRIYAWQGNYEDSKKHFLESNLAVQKQVQKYFPLLSGKEREKFYARVKSRCESFNSFALSFSKGKEELIGEVYDMQIANKALLFNADNQIRQRVLNSKNDSLIALYSRWQEKRNALAKVYQMNSEDRRAAGIQVNLLEEQLNSDERKLSSSGYTLQEKLYSWKDIQRQLKKNEATVEMIRFRKTGIYEVVTDSSNAMLPKYAQYGFTDTVGYAALIVTAQSYKPELVLFANGNNLEKRYLKTYKNSIRFKVHDTTSYTMFWKSIAKVLAKEEIKNVYFSPDGVFNSININTLFNHTDNRYVSDEVEIIVVSSTRDLVSRKTKAQPAKIKNAVLLGFPEYNANERTTNEDDKMRSVTHISLDSSQRFFQGGVIAQLPGTKTEVKAIGKLLAAHQINFQEFTERKATEEEVKFLKSPQVLHIATHGFFLQDITAHDQAFAGFEAKAFLDNPLLRSGLLLTGSQNTINGTINSEKADGILTAYEAMNLNLIDTELVVLSACETGLGEIRNGEGVYGLQRALQTAGAQSVLMSLWKVDDHATQQLMTEFYRYWLKTGDKRAAFKKAQTIIRKKYPNPYYWGAFVLVGD